MTTEFNTVFNAIGWGGFYIVHEHGIELLTKEFLCTLQITTNGVAFRMFGEEYNLTWSLLNTALGFEHECELDLDHALHMFNKEEFWKAISGSNDCLNPIPDQIHNPTLRFIHYWIVVTLFPGISGCTVSDDELKLLYAMVKKSKSHLSNCS